MFALMVHCAHAFIGGYGSCYCTAGNKYYNINFVKYFNTASELVEGKKGENTVYAKTTNSKIQVTHGKTVISFKVAKDKIDAASCAVVTKGKKNTSYKLYDYNIQNNFAVKRGKDNCQCSTYYVCANAASEKVIDNECNWVISWISPLKKHISTVSQCDSYKNCRCFNCWNNCVPSCKQKLCMVNEDSIYPGGNGGDRSPFCNALQNPKRVQVDMEMECQTNTPYTGHPVTTKNQFVASWNDATCYITSEEDCGITCKKC